MYSPYLQDLCLFVGQSEVYDKGALLLDKLARISATGMQIHRIVEFHSEPISTLLEEEQAISSSIQNGSIVYGMVDGSMILTRHQGWKEVKIGRVFENSSIYELSSSRNCLGHSEYIAHLGSHTAFEEKMSVLTDKYADLEDDLIFINDGAKWIWKWISSAYPKATQILDYYHAVEHLGDFAALYIKDKKTQKKWIETNAELLKKQGVVPLICLLEGLNISSKKIRKEKEKLLNYYKNNINRMDYPTYLKKELLIGSGAVEAAHRTVSQKRLKLSGQRWTEKGAQNVLDLRVVNLSDRWEEVQNMLRAA